MTPALQAILDEQGHLITQAKLHGRGQTRGFAEVDEVFEGECEGNGFGESDVDVEIGLVNVGVGAEGYCAGADVAVAGELDAFFCAFDGHCETRRRQLLTPRETQYLFLLEGKTYQTRLTHLDPYKSSETQD